MFETARLDLQATQAFNQIRRRFQMAFRGLGRTERPSLVIFLTHSSALTSKDCAGPEVSLYLMSEESYRIALELIKKETEPVPGRSNKRLWRFTLLGAPWFDLEVDFDDTSAQLRISEVHGI